AHEPRRRTTQVTGEASGVNEEEQADEAGHSGYEDLSNRLSEMQLTYGLHHQHMEYNTTEALHQANWQSGLMNRMASHFGVAPATPFAPSQFWPFSDDAPPGYPTFEGWRNQPRGPYLSLYSIWLSKQFYFCLCLVCYYLLFCLDCLGFLIALVWFILFCSFYFLFFFLFLDTAVCYSSLGTISGIISLRSEQVK